jgi:FtsH-binding integral membrane protein
VASRPNTPTAHVPGVTATEADSIQRPSRCGLAVLFGLAVANGVFLYFLPARAEPDYAWPIAPPINAAFLGAGYLAGCVAAGLALRARRWRSVRALVWPLVILSAGMLAATLIHADRFRWDYPPTWAWTLVYAGIPPGAALLWLRQERVASAAAARDSRVAWTRRLAWPLGLGFALVGAALFAAPHLVAPAWPWQITPLLGRAFGSWYLMMGALLVVVAVTVRREHEVPIPSTWVGLWSALALLLPLLYGATLRPSGASLAVYVAMHLFALSLCGWALVRAAVSMRGHRDSL